MMKKYWPIAAISFLCLFGLIVLRYTGYDKYVTTYLAILIAIEMLILAVTVIVLYNRGKSHH